jgi:hypothetical protein
MCFNLPAAPRRVTPGGEANHGEDLMRSKLLTTLALLSLIAALTPAADAGWPFSRRARGGACQAQPQMAYQPVACQMAAVPATTAVVADPHGFLAWINDVRSRAGCGPVAWDSNLAAWATQNSARGFGHSVLVARYQDSGVGDLATVCGMWLQSSAHLAPILDPSVTRVGLGCVGAVWTANFD